MDISYLHGREVEGVLSGEEAHGYDGATWVIKLVAEGYILCFDETHEPPVLDGLAFTQSSVSDTETRLYFGTDANPTGTMVVLRPDDYGVMDDLYSKGIVVRASVGPQEAPAPVVPLTDTGSTPDGPSEEYLALQAQRDIDDEDGFSEVERGTDDGT